jgi:hypothetical protein
MDEVGEKRKKLVSLQLEEPEWVRVDLFLNLLAVCSRRWVVPFSKQSHRLQRRPSISFHLISSPHCT